MGFPDWGTAVGAIVGKVTQWIPGPIQAMKNEKEKLINERHGLLQNSATDSARARIIFIDNRLSEINAQIANKSAD